MADKYYYLITSLPYLRFAQGLPVTIETFMAECSKWLSEKDLGILSEASRGVYSKRGYTAPAAKIWTEFDSYLRHELAAARKNRQASSSDNPGQRARVVFEQGNPLLMEKEIERVRWDFLDSVQAEYFFDINFLVIYLLKLKILERIAMFDKDKGEQVFQKMCEVEYA